MTAGVLSAAVSVVAEGKLLALCPVTRDEIARCRDRNARFRSQ
jgi:hypothetical protein